MTNYHMFSLCLVVRVILCSICSGYVVNNMAENTLSITCWNSRGLKAAQSYLTKLTNESDIVIISEHQLYESQLFKLNEINPNFSSLGKCSGVLDPRQQKFIPGHVGIAILWSKTIIL